MAKPIEIKTPDGQIKTVYWTYFLPPTEAERRGIEAALYERGVFKWVAPWKSKGTLDLLERHTVRSRLSGAYVDPSKWTLVPINSLLRTPDAPPAEKERAGNRAPAQPSGPRWDRNSGKWVHEFRYQGGVYRKSFDHKPTGREIEDAFNLLKKEVAAKQARKQEGSEPWTKNPLYDRRLRARNATIGWLQSHEKSHPEYNQKRQDLSVLDMQLGLMRQSYDRTGPLTAYGRNAGAGPTIREAAAIAKAGPMHDPGPLIGFGAGAYDLLAGANDVVQGVGKMSTGMLAQAAPGTPPPDFSNLHEEGRRQVQRGVETMRPVNEAIRDAYYRSREFDPLYRLLPEYVKNPIADAVAGTLNPFEWVAQGGSAVLDPEQALNDFVKGYTDLLDPSATPEERVASAINIALTLAPWVPKGIRGARRAAAARKFNTFQGNEAALRALRELESAPQTPEVVRARNVILQANESGLLDLSRARRGGGSSPSAPKQGSRRASSGSPNRPKGPSTPYSDAKAPYLQVFDSSVPPEVRAPAAIRWASDVSRLVAGSDGRGKAHLGQTTPILRDAGNVERLLSRVGQTPEVIRARRQLQEVQRQLGAASSRGRGSSATAPQHSTSRPSDRNLGSEYSSVGNVPSAAGPGSDPPGQPRGLSNLVEVVLKEAGRGGIFEGDEEFYRFMTFVARLPQKYVEDLGTVIWQAMHLRGKPGYVGLYDADTQLIHTGRDDIDTVMQKGWKRVASRLYTEEVAHHMLRFLSDDDKQVLLKQYDREMEKPLSERATIVEDYNTKKYHYSNFAEWVAARYIRAEEHLFDLEYARASWAEKRVLEKIRHFRKLLQAYSTYYSELLRNPAHRQYLRFVKDGRTDRVKAGELPLDVVYGTQRGGAWYTPKP